MKRQKNVLIICNGYPPFYFGGESIYNLHLADALTKKGYNVFIINPIIVSPENQSTVKVFKPEENISLYQIHINDDDFLSKANAAIAELMKVVGIDIGMIHCSTNRFLDAVSSLKERYQVPLIYTINSMDIAIIYDVLMKKNVDNGIHDLEFYRSEIARAKQMCRNSDIIIATSNAMVSLIMKHYGVHEEKIRMIYNGTEIERFASNDCQDEIADIKNTLNITDEKIILYSGRFEPSKGIQPLAFAVKAILENYKNIKFFFLGNGSLEESLRAQLSGYENVHFVGWVSKEKVIGYYHIADIVVIPSLLEPFGRVTVENMASRTCVIASNADGLNEIVDHNVNGIKLYIHYDKYGDRSIYPEQIIEALESIIHDKKKMDFLVANGIEKAKKFDLNHFIDGIAEVYSEII